MIVIFYFNPQVTNNLIKNLNYAETEEFYNPVFTLFQYTLNY